MTATDVDATADDDYDPFLAFNEANGACTVENPYPDFVALAPEMPCSGHSGVGGADYRDLHVTAVLGGVTRQFSSSGLCAGASGRHNHHTMDCGTLGLCIGGRELDQS